MKKITLEQFDIISVKSINNRFHKAIQNLEVGEAIFIEKKEWNRKSSPSVIIGNIRERKENTGKKFKTRSNNKGWGIMRTA